MGIVFYVWSAIFFIAPLYAGVESSGKFVLYIGGIFCFLMGCVGFGYEVYGLSKRSEQFLLLLYVLVLLTLAALLHLLTVYIPVGDSLFTAMRLVAVGLGIPLSLLLLLGFAGFLDALPAPTNRTDAILTVLAFLGALLPIVVSIFSAP